MTFDGTNGSTTVHVLCPVHNGAKYLPAFLASLAAQQYANWVLWAVDDQSTDESTAILLAAAAADTRIHVHPTPDIRLGAAGAFAWLWMRVPVHAQAMAFADQDDVWYPDKLSHCITALCRAERQSALPILVHTDLEVVGAALEPVALSFWRYAGIIPEPATLRRVVSQNVATGCTMLFNRALYDAVGGIPDGVTMHDAWVACVAALSGRIVTLPERTVRYRQHGANTLGAHESVSALPWHAVPARFLRAVCAPNPVKRQIAGTAAQAALLLACFAARLSVHDRQFLESYASIPHLGWWARKRAVAALHCHREHGWLRNAGMIWRA